MLNNLSDKVKLDHHWHMMFLLDPLKPENTAVLHNDAFRVILPATVMSSKALNGCKTMLQICQSMGGCMDFWISTFLDFCQSQYLLRTQEMWKLSLYVYLYFCCQLFIRPEKETGLRTVTVCFVAFKCLNWRQTSKPQTACCSAFVSSPSMLLGNWKTACSTFSANHSATTDLLLLHFL